MPQDRYTKVVLTLLVLGVWALALTQIGTPAVLAEVAEDAVAGVASLEPISNEVAVSGAPAATYPLRWYIPLVLHVVESGTLECQTTIGVVNPNTSSVNVEIEFLDASGTILTTESSTIVAGGLFHVGTEGLSQYPNTGTLTMDGHGRVYADNPNILSLNYIDCISGDVSMESFAVRCPASMLA